MSHCALRRKDNLCAHVHWFCVSRKGGTGGGGWSHLQGDLHMLAVVAVWKMPWLALGGPILALGHPQGDLHMLAVVAVCRNALVGTGWSPGIIFTYVWQGFNDNIVHFHKLQNDKMIQVSHSLTFDLFTSHSLCHGFYSKSNCTNLFAWLRKTVHKCCLSCTPCI